MMANSRDDFLLQARGRLGAALAGLDRAVAEAPGFMQGQVRVVAGSIEAGFETLLGIIADEMFPAPLPLGSEPGTNVQEPGDTGTVEPGPGGAGQTAEPVQEGGAG